MPSDKKQSSPIYSSKKKSRQSSSHNDGTRGKSKTHSSQPKQSGGSASGYSGLWHASSPTNVQALSQYTAQRLGNTPMFNPLAFNTEMATPTSGVTPTGVHLGNGPALSNYFCHGRPIFLQGGGGELEANPRNWNSFIEQV